MRSPEAALLALLLTASAAVHAQQDAASAPASAPVVDEAAVRTALEAVRADPLLPGKEKSKSLRFKKSEEEEKKPRPVSDTNWWIELIGHLTAGMRVLIWLVGAGLFIWVLMRAWGWLRKGEVGIQRMNLPPTHVGTLDIRPESLPADIGAAARALWQRGEARAALSLLYRGALSRLVHAHSVPIRAASTEGDCLALAGKRLAPGSQVFLAQLIGCWQAVAYAQRQPQAVDMELLCAEFDRQLGVAA